MYNHVAENLRRVMAQLGLSVREVIEQTGLDRRTIFGILDGSNRPHARTLTRLAQGLAVSADEFFVHPSQLLYQRFDVQTNPLVAEVVQSQPVLFADWTQGDFDELHSHFGEGGALTADGVLQAVHHLNRRRELVEKFTLLLESDHGRVLGSLVETLYREVLVEEE